MGSILMSTVEVPKMMGFDTLSVEAKLLQKYLSTRELLSKAVFTSTAPTILGFLVIVRFFIAFIVSYRTENNHKTCCTVILAYINIFVYQIVLKYSVAYLMIMFK